MTSQPSPSGDEPSIESLLAKMNSLVISKTGFVFDPESGQSFSANETGLEILKAFCEGKGIDEVKLLLEMTYEVSPEVACDGLSNFISQLNRYLS